MRLQLNALKKGGRHEGQTRHLSVLDGVDRRLAGLWCDDTGHRGDLFDPGPPSPAGKADNRLLTLADTVEFFNLVLELKLNEQEKKDLVAFMRAL